MVEYQVVAEAVGWLDALHDSAHRHALPYALQNFVHSRDMRLYSAEAFGAFARELVLGIKGESDGT